MAERARIPARRRFRRGALEYHRARLPSAQKEFSAAADLFWEKKDFSSYFDCWSYRLRIGAEQNEKLDFQDVRARMLKAIAAGQFAGALLSQAHQLLALMAVSTADYAQAKAEYLKALNVQIPPGDEAVFGPAHYGLAFTARSQNDLAGCLRHLAAIESLLVRSPHPYLATKFALLKANTLRECGRIAEAREAAWTAYRSLRDYPDFVHYIHALNVLAKVEIDQGDRQAARQFLDLANAALVGTNMPRLAEIIGRTSAHLEGAESSGHVSLQFESKQNVLMNSAGSSLAFEDRFILRDLFGLFARNPGISFDKETIIGRVWNEKYDPAVHDNKLYVTIQRLRRFIEKDGFVPPGVPVVVRAKEGYCLNPIIDVRLVGLN